MTAVQDNLKARNAQYASSFKSGSLALPPAKKYTIVTCMDARIHAAEAFGVDLGDAHIIRNAGGSARDALRSLVISQQLLGTKEVLIIKHTGCGMLTFSNEDARAVVKKNLGDQAAQEVSGLDFLPFTELASAVKSDVEFLKTNKAIGDNITVSGWVYEVETGKVKAV